MQFVCKIYCVNVFPRAIDLIIQILKIQKIQEEHGVVPPVMIKTILQFYLLIFNKNSVLLFVLFILCTNISIDSETGTPLIARRNV